MSILASIHSFLDRKYYEARMDDKKTDVEKARALLTGYVLRYEHDGYKTVAVEYPAEDQIIDPETNKPLVLKGKQGDPLYGGIMDTVLEKDGELLICDHKVLSKVDDALWEELKTNQQVGMYSLLSYQKGWPVRGFLYDVIAKPDISRKAITKKAKIELDAEGTYCGMKFRSMEFLDEAVAAERETPVMYGMRLLKDVIEYSDQYFFRRVIRRDEDTLYDLAADMSTIRKQMHMSETGELPVYRNREACKQFGRLCDYWSICSHQNDEEVGFRVREKSGENKLSSGCLTHSRISCFNQCRYKWYRKYVDKVEKIEPDYSDSLAVGSMVHQCLEIFLHDPKRKSTFKL